MDFPPDIQSMVATPVVTPVTDYIDKCSSYTKMKRVVAWCHRFINNARSTDRNFSNSLSAQELRQAQTTIIKIVQQAAFKLEIKQCERRVEVKSNVKFLAAFLDGEGILRVGGRLTKANLPLDQIHPVLLPAKHNFTEQLVRFLHLTHLHAAPQLLLAISRQQYWIIRGKDVAKRIVKGCVTCHRHNPAIQQQLMGQLPVPRVSQSRPFSQCGVDYAGPFKLSLRTGRNPPLTKHYVSLFVCMATRAIHLELVSDLTTPAFIAALTRFISRRGQPLDIYCDGGTNFEGTKNEMKEFRRLTHSDPHNSSLSTFLAANGTTFHFIPPYGPHHGGLWEAGVKSMKTHLKRVIGDRHLTVEEFSTLLVQVEACLNSRPLTPISNDPNDFSALIPAHFLIGDSLAALPQHDLTEIKQGRLSRWQVAQSMFQHFWRRWHMEYLGQLQSRPKWFSALPNLEVGTLVLIRDDDPKWGPLKWKLGRISAVFPGPDGKTRVCDVRVSSGAVYRRPIVKLSPLPIYD